MRINKNKYILLFSIILISGLCLAQGIQDKLKTAKELWEQGKCEKAIEYIMEIRFRLNDFPENVRPEIENMIVQWETFSEQQKKLVQKIENNIPSIRDDENKLIPLKKLQAVRDSFNTLYLKSDEIECVEMRKHLQLKISGLIDSVNIYVDKYVEQIIAQNEDLKIAVDSLKRLARKYKQFVPVVDSLKSLIARKSDDMEKLQKQVDSILLMVSQTANISTDEEFTSISNPVTMVANALLEGVQNKIIAIGEGRVKRKDYGQEQRDSLMGELNAIVAWLDTSTVARNSPDRANALKKLCFGYMDTLASHKKSSDAVKWIALTLLIFIVIIALIIAFKQRK
ncbi:hypothetical protein DRQ33_06200 [bacterium]|nr:MAG: hypothetical protein DRQ33_06200 [bacterium]